MYKKQFKSSFSIFSICFITFASIFISCPSRVEAESMYDGHMSSFFLKSSKSVPRVGRSSPQAEPSGFFINAPKSIPRVGRRNEGEMEFPSIPQDYITTPHVMTRRTFSYDNEENELKNLAAKITQAVEQVLMDEMEIPEYNNYENPRTKRGAILGKDA